MPYLGRHYLGATVPVYLLTVNASGTPTVPDDAPVVEIWSSSALVTTKKMPVHDRYAATGLFLLPLRLDSNFSAGRYRLAYRYDVGSHTGLEEDVLEVLPGGHSDGAVQSMCWAEFPHAHYLVHHLESGTVVFGRNPKS